MDLFHVQGGERHEYILVGDANHAGAINTDLSRFRYGETLLPSGVTYRLPAGENVPGDAEGHNIAYAYVRNVVVRHLTDNAPDWAGIVEEGFPAEAVTDPMVWYCTDGDQKKFKENLGRMMESVNAFLEIDRVESHPMSEYLMSDG